MGAYDWKVGDRVQKSSRNEEILVGVVTAVESAQEERTRYTHSLYGRSRQEEKYMETVIKSITVKWDNGGEEKLKQYDVHQEDSELERAFRLASRDAQRRIAEKLEQAMAALNEAEAISEETGVPFSSGISPLGQSYIPASLEDKYPDVDREFIDDITGSYGECGGWQHSAVC